MCDIKRSRDEDFLRSPTPGHRATWRYHRHAGSRLQHIAAYFDMEWHGHSSHTGNPVCWHLRCSFHHFVPTRSDSDQTLPGELGVAVSSVSWQIMAALMSLMYSPAYSRPSGLPTTKFCLQETSISLQIWIKSVQSCSPCAKGIDRKWYSIHSRLSSIAEIPVTKKIFLAARSNWVPCQVNLPRPCIRLPSHCPWHGQLSHVSDSASVFPFSKHKYFKIFETKYSTWFNKSEETLTMPEYAHTFL